MPRIPVLDHALPLLPALAGLAFSVWRIHEHDPFGGLAGCIGGLLLTVVVIFRQPRRPL